MNSVDLCSFDENFGTHSPQATKNRSNLLYLLQSNAYEVCKFEYLGTCIRDL